MRTYTGKDSVFAEALGSYGEYGFRLVEVDDHMVELWFKDNRIATYISTTITIDLIREGCKNYLKAIARWS